MSSFTAGAKRVFSIVLLAAPVGAFQVVHVVQPGVPAAIQIAVDAAADGDVVLVRAGSYGPVRVTNKALSIVADPTGGARVASLTIDGLAAAKTCSVQGVVTTDFELPERASIRVLACAGQVLFEDVRSQFATATAAQAAFVAGSSGVTFSRCTLEGSTQQPPFNQFPDPAGRGLTVAASQVAAYGCTIRGAPGRSTVFASGAMFQGGHGAAGVQVSDVSSVFFASGTTIRGGAGGYGVGQLCSPYVGPTPGFNGAAGVLAAGTTVLRDCDVTGGLGGLGGFCMNCQGWPPPPPDCHAAHGTPAAPIVGNATVLATPRVDLEAPGHVREGTTLPIGVRGPVGSTALLAVSTSWRWSFMLAMGGTLHSGLPTRRLPLGIVPAGGLLLTSLPIPALAPGVPFQRSYVQLFARDASGVVSTGTPIELLILDSSF